MLKKNMSYYGLNEGIFCRSQEYQPVITTRTQVEFEILQDYFRKKEQYNLENYPMLWR